MKECPECNNDNNDQGKNPESEHIKEFKTEKNWVKLTNAANEIEFNMIAGLLDMAGIPVIKEVSGIDGFLEIMIGVPVAGINVMVPEEKYEEALQLISAQVDEQELEKEIKESEETSGQENGS